MQSHVAVKNLLSFIHCSKSLKKERKEFNQLISQLKKMKIYWLANFENIVSITKSRSRCKRRISLHVRVENND